MTSTIIIVILQWRGDMLNMYFLQENSLNCSHRFLLRNLLRVPRNSAHERCEIDVPMDL